MVKMLGAFLRRLARGRARERYRTDAGNSRWIDPEDGDVALGVRGEDTRRHLPFARELHLRRGGCADAALIRDDEPFGVDKESRRVRVRRPDADDAVPPLLQEEAGIGLRRRPGRRIGRAEVGDLRVGCRQIEDRVAAGRDVHRLHPLVAAAAERERLVGLDGVVPGPELHLHGPVERGDDAPRRRSRRIVADEERIPRRRRRRAIRIGEHDPDAQHAERLSRRRRWQDEDERRERQGSKAGDLSSIVSGACSVRMNLQSLLRRISRLRLACGSSTPAADTSRCRAAARARPRPCGAACRSCRSSR